MQQWSTAFTWLIGALAAVAAAMIVGSQLTTIGQLSSDSDKDRLTLAVVGIVVAVGLILVSIGLLFWAQTPSNTDFVQLKELANGTSKRGVGGRVRAQVEADTSLNRNTGSLLNLMAKLEETRQDYYSLRGQHYNASREAAKQDDEIKRKVHERTRDRVVNEITVVDQKLNEYRTALQRVSHLASFLRARRRFRAVSWVVMCLAVLSTLAFVTFAWAANPP